VGKKEVIRPKTQIQIGRWTAIVELVGDLGRTLIVLFGFRGQSILWRYIVWPIVFSNGLSIVIFACLFFTIGRRLLRTSLFLMIAYTFLMIRTFFIWEYIDAEDILFIVGELFMLLCLWQGVIGVYREKHG
jgi:hypothetical protein